MYRVKVILQISAGENKARGKGGRNVKNFNLVKKKVMHHNKPRNEKMLLRENQVRM